MAGLKFKQLRDGWLRAENGWLEVLSISEMAGYELRMAGLKFEAAQRRLATSLDVRMDEVMSLQVASN
jgi:hypothetical protein